MTRTASTSALITSVAFSFMNTRSTSTRIATPSGVGLDVGERVAVVGNTTRAVVEITGDDVVVANVVSAVVEDITEGNEIVVVATVD